MKNSLTTLAILLTLALLATSCWKTTEDWSLCVDTPPPPPPPPPEPARLVLDFSLHATPDERFTDTIRVVDVYLFDAAMKLIETRELTEAMLREDLTTSWNDIEPGTYYAIAWGNVNIEEDNTSETNDADGPENNFLEIVSEATGSPVYFAPLKATEILTATRGAVDYSIFKAEVVAEKTTVKPMMFDKAHRTVDVFIRPDEWVTGKLPGTPIITRTGAGGWTDFLNRNDITDLLTLSGPMHQKKIDGEMWWTVHFHSAWLNPLKENSGDVYIVNPADGAAAPATTIDLYDYVVENDIVKRYGDDSYIPIRYRISGQIIPCLPGDDLPGDDPIKEEIDNPPGPDPDSDNVSVSVELPPWNSHNVNPIF